MKRIVMLLLMVLLPAIVFAEITRKVVDKYPDVGKGEITLPGQPKTIIYLNSKGKEVAKEICDESGKIIETTGKIPDGIIKEYYESGKLLAEYNYKDGKLEGLSKGYYESGAFRGEWNYKSGKLEGIVKVFYENGNLNYEMNFQCLYLTVHVLHHFQKVEYINYHFPQKYLLPAGSSHHSLSLP